MISGLPASIIFYLLAIRNLMTIFRRLQEPPQVTIDSEELMLRRLDNGRCMQMVEALFHGGGFVFQAVPEMVLLGVARSDQTTAQVMSDQRKNSNKSGRCSALQLSKDKPNGSTFGVFPPFAGIGPLSHMSRLHPSRQQRLPRHQVVRHHLRPGGSWIKRQ